MPWKRGTVSYDMSSFRQRRLVATACVTWAAINTAHLAQGIRLAPSSTGRCSTCGIYDHAVGIPWLQSFFWGAVMFQSYATVWLFDFIIWTYMDISWNILAPYCLWQWKFGNLKHACRKCFWFLCTGFGLCSHMQPFFPHSHTCMFVPLLTHCSLLAEVGITRKWDMGSAIFGQSSLAASTEQFGKIVSSQVKIIRATCTDK